MISVRWATRFVGSSARASIVLTIVAVSLVRFGAGRAYAAQKHDTGYGTFTEWDQFSVHHCGQWRAYISTDWTVDPVYSYEGWVCCTNG